MDALRRKTGNAVVSGGPSLHDRLQMSNDRWHPVDPFPGRAWSDSYSNLLSVSQARVSQGRLDFGVGWWLVHAGMVLLLLFMFAQRMQLIRLRVGR